MKKQEKLKSTVLKLYYAGTKVADIVTQTRVPRSTVYYWIKNGIPKELSPLNLRDYHFLKQKCERQEKIIKILKSAPCTSTAPLQERLVAIEHMVSEEYNVNTLCEALNVAKGTYYNHTLRNKRGETQNAQRQRELFPIIEQIYHESNQTYGAGRITVVMHERGIPVAESTVAHIMHENGLFSIRGGAKALYYRNKERKENIIKQNFTVNAPNEVWVSDVTYIHFNNKTYYLCAILDLYARKVIAWRISPRNNTHLTKRTLKLAIIDRIPSTGLIFHSDNGANFTSFAFTSCLKEYGIKQSFSRTHNPYDNSICESFFKTLKQEEIYRRDYRSEKDMLCSITRFMEFYNNDRPHSTNGYKSPNRYEAEYYNKKAVQKT